MAKPNPRVQVALLATGFVAAAALATLFFLADAAKPAHAAGLGDALGQLTEPVTTLTAPVTQAVAPVTNALQPVTQAVAPVTEVVQPVTQSATAATTPLTSSAGALPTAPSVLAPVTNSVASVVGQATEQLAPVTDAITPLAAPLAQAVEPLVELAAPVISNLVAPVDTVLDPIVTALPPIVADALSPLAPLTRVLPIVDDLVPPTGVRPSPPTDPPQPNAPNDAATSPLDQARPDPQADGNAAIIPVRSGEVSNALLTQASSERGIRAAGRTSSRPASPDPASYNSSSRTDHPAVSRGGPGGMFAGTLSPVDGGGTPSTLLHAVVQGPVDFALVAKSWAVTDPDVALRLHRLFVIERPG